MAKNIYSELGLNKRELHGQALNTWKMMWEQILILALYARQQYFKESAEAENFQQRIKMIHLLSCEYASKNNSNLSFDKDIREIFQKTLDLIEDECGSTKIIEFLLDEETSTLQTSKKCILSKMEEAKIAFSPMPHHYTRDYSYYSLYSILHNPIFFISKLLSISEPDEHVITNTVITTIYDYLCQNKRFLMGIRTGNPFENFKDKPLQEKERIIIENFSFLKDKQQIKKLIQGQIAEFIGKDVQKTFNQLSDPFFSEHDQENKFFASIVEIDSDTETFKISVDKKAFVNLMNLNQLDELALVMKSELKKYAQNKNGRTRISGIENRLDQAAALEKISDWYSHSNTGLFTRADQIPKIIVSILEFDIRYFKGMFDPELGFNKTMLTAKQKPYSQLQAKEIYMLVSAYIRNRLYYNDKRDDRDSMHGWLLDGLVNRTFDGILLHPNRMMEAWVGFESELEQQKMLDRFKRMSPYLKVKNPKMVESLIQDQKNKGNDESAPPYPLNSFFPLPLWSSRFTKNIRNEEIPEKLS